MGNENVKEIIKEELGKFCNITDMQSDKDAERDGIDVSFGKGRFITIKRSGADNREYRAAMARLFSPHQKPGGSVSLSDEAATGLLREVYAEAIVVGWRGLTDNLGKDILYSKKNCMMLFDEAPEIFDIIQTESAKFSNFARREIEESGK